MLNGLLVALSALRHVQNRGYLYIWANVLCVLCCIPIITAPAAWAGLCRFSYLLYRQPSVEFEEFWLGFRAHFRRTLPIAFLNPLLVVMTWVNINGGQAVLGDGYPALRVIWIGGLVIWFALQLYAFPLLHAMETPRLLGAYRNALVMALLNPLFTLGIWGAAVVIVLISTLFPFAWVLATFGLLAAIGNAAVFDRLRAAGIERAETPQIDVEGGAFTGGFGEE